jgi:hypothetical protein
VAAGDVATKIVRTTTKARKRNAPGPLPEEEERCATACRGTGRGAERGYGAVDISAPPDEPAPVDIPGSAEWLALDALGLPPRPDEIGPGVTNGGPEKSGEALFPPLPPVPLLLHAPRTTAANRLSASNSFFNKISFTWWTTGPCARRAATSTYTFATSPCSGRPRLRQRTNATVTAHRRSAEIAGNPDFETCENALHGEFQGRILPRTTEKEVVSRKKTTENKR